MNIKVTYNWNSFIICDASTSFVDKLTSATPIDQHYIDGRYHNFLFWKEGLTVEVIKDEDLPMITYEEFKSSLPSENEEA